MKFAFAAAALLAVVSAPASAQTASFDDVGQLNPVPNGYAGLDWNNFYAISNSYYSQSGYNNGVVSGDSVAFNGYEGTATISGASPFTFNSGYFTGAWNDGVQVNVTGYVGGVATYFDSFTVDSIAPTLHSFNWTGLSSVSFIGTGGTSHGYGGGGSHIAFDDLVFNSAAGVPEPAAWGMMIGGFGLAGMALRRRSSAKLALAL